MWYYPFKCSFQSVFFVYPTCVSSYLCKFILLTSTTIQPPLDMAKDHTFPSPNILFVIKPTSAIGLLNKVLGIEDKKIGSTLTECRLSFSPISHKSLNRVNSGSSSTDVGETQDLACPNCSSLWVALATTIPRSRQCSKKLSWTLAYSYTNFLKLKSRSPQMGNFLREIFVFNFFCLDAL